MNSTDTLDLYSLLPEFIRRDDLARLAPGQTRAPLQALFDAAQSQADIVYADIAALWRNFFVETCDDWMLPYIADRIGLNLINDLPADNRRELARTIGYRRRKGTVPQLETMARDVTGYDCHVVEFFTRLVWTQNMIHLRMATPATVDVRDRAAMSRIGSAFDRSLCTADVRPADQGHGHFAIRKLGFLLWRLQPIPLDAVELRRAQSAPAGTTGYHFNTLDQPEPLFQMGGTLDHPTDAPWPRTDEFHVSGPIAPASFAASPASYWQTATSPSPDYTGPHGFTVFVDGVASTLKPMPTDLCNWKRLPPAGGVAVDVRLGRLAFAPGDPLAPSANAVVTASYFAGLNGPIGGGGYQRDLTLPLEPGENADIRDVTQTGGTPISAALTALAASPARVRVVRILDSRRYEGEPLPLPAQFDTLVIEAAQGQRPEIALAKTAQTPIFGGPLKGRLLILRGLLFSGLGEMLSFPAQIETIQFEDCTVDPGGGRASDGVSMRPAGITISAAPAPVGVSLRFVRSIVGALALPQSFDCVSFTDSIADTQAFASRDVLVPVAPATAGPPATVERSTIFGDFRCYRLEASDAIFTGTLVALRRQTGCVRFCALGPAPQAPRRYECVSEGAPPPVFTSRQFGDPAYAQLALNCDAAYTAGGDDGNEMGVWASQGGTRRLAHLDARLREYLPAGLVPVRIFVT